MSDTQNNLDTATISVAPVVSEERRNARQRVELDVVSVMAMNRKERRRLGKINSVKIVGSTKPYEVKSKKD